MHGCGNVATGDHCGIHTHQDEGFCKVSITRDGWRASQVPGHVGTGPVGAVLAGEVDHFCRELALLSTCCTRGFCARSSQQHHEGNTPFWDLERG